MEPFYCPQYNRTTSLNGVVLCPYVDCQICRESPEFALLHYDCYVIFTETCQLELPAMLERLWVVALVKKPWRGARPTSVERLKAFSNGAAFKRTVRLSKLPRMLDLPVEILEEIRHYSRYSLFWRCVAALQLADDIVAMRKQAFYAMRLSDVRAWERDVHLDFEPSNDPESLPVMRITLDCDGINKIERLAAIPQYEQALSNRFHYIVESVAALSDVSLLLQHGRVRLEMPPGKRTPIIWNSPAPLQLENCKTVSLKDGHRWWRGQHIVQTNRIRGITFFFSEYWLIDMYVHYNEDSCALQKYQRFSSGQRQRCVWIYLPNLDKDPLISLGIRKYEASAIGVLAKTLRGGEVVIGRVKGPEGQARDHMLAEGAPITLAYNEPSEMSPITSFAAVGGSELDGSMRWKSQWGQVEYYKDLQMVWGHVYFSASLLENIASTVVFNDKAGFCKGILIYYSNGGCKALGQCRIGIDASNKVIAPTTVCIQPHDPGTRLTLLDVKTKVKFGHDAEHKDCVPFDPQYDLDPEIPWLCFPVAGLMRFWFAASCSWVTIETENGEEKRGLWYRASRYVRVREHIQSIKRRRDTLREVYA